MSKLIPLTRGKFAIVDDADFEWLNHWDWYFYQGYAKRNVGRKGKRRRMRMHRVILKPPPNMECDHINGNGLDNRRCNLRVATKSQNSMNSRKRAGTTSQYKGVCWDKERNKWRAGISVNGRTHSLGRFMEEDEAAYAYNRAARQYFGEFARLNVIEKQ